MGKGRKREIHNMCIDTIKKDTILTVSPKWWLEDDRGVK